MNNTQIITNGLITCPAQGLDGVPLDILIEDGKITALDEHIESKDATVIDAAGALVTPALIDLHTHTYWGATSLSVRAEDVARKSGTGTFVDAGSAGGGNFHGFREFIISKSDLRYYAFLNVSFGGIFGFSHSLMVGEGEIERLLNAEACHQTIANNRDLIIGVKVRAGLRASGQNGMTAIKVGRDVAQRLDIPLMCHVDASPPSISEGLEQLQKGDVLTHCSRGGTNSVVNETGSAIPELIAARERGVLLDIGHGMGGYDFTTSKRMLELGIAPDAISSDIHALCIDGPAFDQLTTLNKLVTLGMPLLEVFRACTQGPADIIRHPELGSLEPGTPADIAFFQWTDEKTVYVDAPGNELNADRHLECHGLFVGGRTIGADGRAIN